MLGFATLDISARDKTLTVWLTSQLNRTAAGHTNAVTFSLNDTFDPIQAQGMLADRYVVLTERTQVDDDVLTGWGVQPCDLASFAHQTDEEQQILMHAFKIYRLQPRKADLVEPLLPPVPGPVEEDALDHGTAQTLTLALANRVQRTWTAWLVTEDQRVKRRAYMPTGWDGGAAGTVPPDFARRSVAHPLRSKR